MIDVDFPVNDFDNHYYEALDAFTRHLDPRLGRRIIQWAEIDGRKYHVIGGKVSHAVVNPTFDPIAKAGAMSEYFRGNASGRNPLEYLREREPIRPEYRDRDARLRSMDEQGLDKIWLFPTLGMIYEQLLKDDPEGVGIMFRAFNRWLEEDWGYEYQDRIFASPYIALCDLDCGGRASSSARWASARAPSCMRPAAPTTPTGPRTPGDPYFDPFWARANEAGITVVVHAGRQRLLVERLRARRLLRRLPGRRPPVDRHAVDGARHLRLPRVARVRPALRPLPEPADRVGRERRRVPPRPVPQAEVGQPQDPRPLPGRPDRDVQASRVDQPVLGGRRLRDRRPHGRRPRRVRIRLAAHRGPAVAPRLLRGDQGARRRLAAR